MSKTRTTIYVDEEVMRAARVYAARTGKRDYEVVEEALRDYLGLSVLERVWETAAMDPAEALDLAVEETRAARRARR